MGRKGKVNTLTNEPLPENIKVYKNGALFDKDKGRIIAMRPELAEKNTQITSQSSGELLARRVAKKRELIAAGALQAVENDDTVRLFGEDAWIYEIGRIQAIKATTPDDPKSTDAARFLFQEAGISDKQAANSPDNMPSSAVLAQLAQFAADVVAPLIAQRENGFDNYTYRNHETVDGTVAQDADPADQVRRGEGGEEKKGEGG